MVMFCVAAFTLVKSRFYSVDGEKSSFSLLFLELYLFRICLVIFSFADISQKPLNGIQKACRVYQLCKSTLLFINFGTEKISDNFDKHNCC